jgi:hypothetical protein
MKNLNFSFVLIVLMLVIGIKTKAETTSNDGSSCTQAIQLCADASFYKSICGVGQLPQSADFWFYFNQCSPCPGAPFSFNICIRTDNVNAEVTTETTGAVVMGAPFCSFPLSVITSMQPPTCPVCTHSELPDLTSYNQIFCTEGSYLYHIHISGACKYEICIDFKEGNPCCTSPPPVPPTDCTECIDDYGMAGGKTYLVSTWVSESPMTDFDTNFDKPQISINFIPSGTVVINPNNQYLIIDGWQKMEKEIVVPPGTTGMIIKFECLSGDCYFDDIRIHPKDGSMKTYVYDSTTLRLVAQMDERNYATFYEYDEEGRLIRTKKETERGIMTIQENILSTVKNPN